MKTSPVIALLALLQLSSTVRAEPTPEQWTALWAEDQKAEKSGICQVHQAKMTPTGVPIHYGLIRQAENGPSEEQRIKLFPHARKFQEGGCCVIPGETTATIPVCPACVTAEAKWVSSHKKP